MSRNIHDAIRSGNMSEVEIRLNMGEDINQSFPPKYQTPLHAAVEMDDSTVVEVLLDRGAQHSVGDRSDVTSLSLAIRLERTEIVKLLERKGATTKSTSSQVPEERLLGRPPPWAVDGLETMKDNIEVSTDDDKSASAVGEKDETVKSVQFVPRKIQLSGWLTPSWTVKKEEDKTANDVKNIEEDKTTYNEKDNESGKISKKKNLERVNVIKDKLTVIKNKCTEKVSKKQDLDLDNTAMDGKSNEEKTASKMSTNKDESTSEAGENKPVKSVNLSSWVTLPWTIEKVEDTVSKDVQEGEEFDNQSQKIRKKTNIEGVNTVKDKFAVIKNRCTGIIVSTGSQKNDTSSGERESSNNEVSEVITTSTPEQDEEAVKMIPRKVQLPDWLISHEGTKEGVKEQKLEKTEEGADITENEEVAIKSKGQTVKDIKDKIAVFRNRCVGIVNTAESSDIEETNKLTMSGRIHNKLLLLTHKKNTVAIDEDPDKGERYNLTKQNIIQTNEVTASNSEEITNNNMHKIHTKMRNVLRINKNDDETKDKVEKEVDVKENAKPDNFVIAWLKSRQGIDLKFYTFRKKQ